jgi:methionine aminopeptidase
MPEINRSALSGISSALGVVGYSIPLQGVMSNVEAYGLLEPFITLGLIDYRHPAQQSLSALLNAAPILMATQGVIAYNEDHPVPASELLNLQKGVLTPAEFVLRGLAVDGAALVSALNELDTVYNPNIEKSAATIGHLIAVVDQIRTYDDQEHHPVSAMSLLMPHLTPAALQTIEWVYNLKAPTMAPAALEKVSVKEFLQFANDLFKRGSDVESVKNATPAMRRAGTELVNFMLGRVPEGLDIAPTVVDREGLRYFMEHPQEIAQRFGVAEASVQDIADRIPTILASSTKKYIPFAEVVLKTLQDRPTHSNVMEHVAELRSVGISPTFEHGLNFTDVEKYAAAAALDEETLQAFRLLFEPEFRSRAINVNSQLFSLQEARALVEAKKAETTSPIALARLNVSWEELGKIEDEDAFYSIYRALFGVLHNTAEEALRIYGIPAVMRIFGVNLSGNKPIEIEIVNSGELSNAVSKKSTTAQVKLIKDPKTQEIIKYVVRVDAVSNFAFRIQDGRLSVDLNLMGYYNFGKGAHELIHIGVSNIRDNVSAITGLGRLDYAARSKYASILKEVARMEGRPLEPGDFEIEELGVNETITRFYSLREATDAAYGDFDLQGTESTFLTGGFTGHANDVLQTVNTVDWVVNEIVHLSDRTLLSLVHGTVVRERELATAAEMKQKQEELDAISIHPSTKEQITQIKANTQMRQDVVAAVLDRISLGMSGTEIDTLLQQETERLGVTTTVYERNRDGKATDANSVLINGRSLEQNELGKPMTIGISERELEPGDILVLDGGVTAGTPKPVASDLTGAYYIAQEGVNVSEVVAQPAYQLANQLYKGVRAGLVAMVEATVVGNLGQNRRKVAEQALENSGITTDKGYFAQIHPAHGLFTPEQGEGHAGLLIGPMRENMVLATELTVGKEGVGKVRLEVAVRVTSARPDILGTLPPENLPIVFAKTRVSDTA